jgi:hypothetical protein
MPRDAIDWIAQARPEAPEALVQRVREVLASDPRGGTLDVAGALLEAANALLDAVLRDGGAGRERALDLLAADACVTWAFEAAADDPATLGERARLTMQRLEQVVA